MRMRACWLGADVSARGSLAAARRNTQALDARFKRTALCDWRPVCTPRVYDDCSHYVLHPEHARCSSLYNSSGRSAEDDLIQISTLYTQRHRSMPGIRVKSDASASRLPWRLDAAMSLADVECNINQKNQTRHHTISRTKKNNNVIQESRPMRCGITEVETK